MRDPKSDPRLPEAFEQMWGAFPEPMVLLHRDRTILAQNVAAKAQPWGEIGGRCFDLNPAANGRACQGCQANAALKQGTTVTCEGDLGGKRLRGYWIPVQGTSDLYIHGYTTIGSAPPVAP
jgi:hypothetical protein